MGLLSTGPDKQAKFLTGRNATAIFLMEGFKLVVEVTQWSAKPKVTEGDDHVNGEDYARHWVQVDGYSVQLTCKARDTKLIRALLADAEYSEGGGPPRAKGFGLVIKPNDGSKEGLSASGETTVGAWELTSQARTDTLSVSLPIHFQKFKEVQV